MNFSKDEVSRIFADCTLAPRTAQIADYWLSLWDADGFATRASISPSQIKPLLPGVIIFRVVPGQSVTVRMAGTHLYRLLNFELTGADWLAITPRKDRDARLAVFSDVASGSVALGRWTFPQDGRRAIRCEKLLLPLRAGADDEAVAVLGFIDWIPSVTDAPDVNLKSIPSPELLDHAAARKREHGPEAVADTSQTTGRPRAVDVK